MEPSRNKPRKAPPTKYDLTDKYIRERPRPTKGNVIDFDKEVKGFAVRFTSAAEATFVFCYGSGLGGGSARRMVIGKWTPSTGKASTSVVREMRKLAATYRSQVLAGADPYAERLATAAAAADQRLAEQRDRERQAMEQADAQRRADAEVTVNQLCDMYLRDHGRKLRPKTKRAAELRINRYLRPAWGERKAKDISKADMKALLTPIREAGKRAELVHVLTLTGSIFKFAMKSDDIEGVATNPTEDLRDSWLDLKKHDAVPVGERALTTKREFRAFYLITQPGVFKTDPKPMHPDEAAALRLMMLTGCRPSEAAGLPWSEIDMFAKVWNKPADVEGRSKSRRADVIPLVDEAMAILQARRGNGSNYVFPAQRSKGEKPLTVHRLGGALRGAGPRLARMGIEAFTPHDLRRTVTTGLFEVDVSEYLVKRTLNHAVKGVTDTTYNKNTFARQRRAAMNAWVQYLEQMIRGTLPEYTDNVVPFAREGRA